MLSADGPPLQALKREARVLKRVRPRVLDPLSSDFRGQALGAKEPGSRGSWAGSAGLGPAFDAFPTEARFCQLFPETHFLGGMYMVQVDSK